MSSAVQNGRVGVFGVGRDRPYGRSLSGRLQSGQSALKPDSGLWAFPLFLMLKGALHFLWLLASCARSPVEHHSLEPDVLSQNLNCSPGNCSTAPRHQHLLTHDTQAPASRWEKHTPALSPLDFLLTRPRASLFFLSYTPFFTAAIYFLPSKTCLGVPKVIMPKCKTNWQKVKPSTVCLTYGPVTWFLSCELWLLWQFNMLRGTELFARPLLRPHSPAQTWAW